MKRKRTIFLLGILTAACCAASLKAYAGTEKNTRIPVPKAQWSMNTRLDTDRPDLDYASDSRVVFHGYFGLFVYDLEAERITDSLDLKALHCQKVQGTGESRIAVSADGKEIYLYPFDADYMYEYSIEEDSLRKAERISDQDVFTGAKKIRETSLPDQTRFYLCSDTAVEFGDNTCGYLYIGGESVSDLLYVRGDERRKLLTEKDNPLPDVIKQDESYYEAYKQKAGKSYEEFINAYTTMYHYRDYAGICALSEGLAYSDELQKQWADTQGKIMYGEEIKTAGSKSCFQLCISHQNGREEYGYLYMKRDADGWYADGSIKSEPPKDAWWREH